MRRIHYCFLLCSLSLIIPEESSSDSCNKRESGPAILKVKSQHHLSTLSLSCPLRSPKTLRREETALYSVDRAQARPRSRKISLRLRATSHHSNIASLYTRQTTRTKQINSLNANPKMGEREVGTAPPSIPAGSAFGWVQGRNVIAGQNISGRTVNNNFHGGKV